MSQSHNKELREQIDALIAERRWSVAHARLADFWQREGKAGTASYILSCYDKMREHLELVPCRVAFLRSMTVEPVVPILRSAALVSGIDATVHVGQFNSYPQEILDPSSNLYSFNPDVAVLTVQTRDIAPEIWERYPESSEADTQEVVNRVLDSYATWIRVFRERTNSSLLIHNLEKPVASQGLLEAQRSNGQFTAINQINAGLRALAAEHRGVYILDYDALLAQHGSLRWHDEAKWLTMRMPFATDSLLPMANAWLKFLHPLTGLTCKVLVLDLDNTLWGGILGEDGMDGIQVGIEYPGANYRSFQRAILDLYYRGILLAICSKNNRDEAMNALRNHPGMLLRPEHFAAFRINWQNKAQNIREIAAELNLGVDSVAFLDDNPVERELIRSEIPEVKVIAVPEQAQKYAQALREFPHFQRLALSSEDLKKTQQYHEQNKRTELAQNSGSLEDFFRSLEQEVVIARATSETLARVAQLTQKTNQFNLTTRRYTEQQIEEFISRGDYAVYSVQVKDRFGDNGIVGVLITRTVDDICEIDSFLMSCRVIGRTIETAMLGFLTEISRADGARALQGWFIPTKKNDQVREIYLSHKFQPIASQDGATLWRLNLQETQIPFPEWIRMNITDNSHRAEEPRA